MSTLGDFLTRMDDPMEVARLLVEAGELGLLVALDREASLSGKDRYDFALDAVQQFTDGADSEAWVKLMGRVQGAESPAAACLAEMIGWSLAHPKLSERRVDAVPHHGPCNCH